MKYDISVDQPLFPSRTVCGKNVGKQRIFAIRDLSEEVHVGAGWSIDHVPTGYRLAIVKDEDTAREMVRGVTQKQFLDYWKKVARSPKRANKFKEFKAVLAIVQEIIRRSRV